MLDRDSQPPHRIYDAGDAADFDGPAPPADPVLPPLSPAPAGEAADPAGDVPDAESPEPPAAEPVEGVAQHVRIVLPPPGPQPARRRALVAAIFVAAIAAGAGAGASVGALTTSRAPQTVVEENLGDPGGLTGLGDPQAILAKVLPALVSVNPSEAPASITAGDFVPGAGTGMILTPGGLVLTDDHVIGGARTVTVTLYGQAEPLRAKLVGDDPAMDVAILQIEGGVRPFPTVSLGDSAAVQQGDDVLAIGNALGLAGGPSVTEGIVSAVQRSLTTPAAHLTGLIQTDAPINPGNSGGPLVDAQGQVVGMNTMVAEGQPGNAPAQNVAFAIAVDDIVRLLPSLERQAGAA